MSALLIENREFFARGSAAVLRGVLFGGAWASIMRSKSARVRSARVHFSGRLQQNPRGSREHLVKPSPGHDEKNADTARHQTAGQQAGGASRAHAASTVSSAGSIAAADPMTEAARTDFSMTIHMVVAVYEHRVV